MRIAVIGCGYVGLVTGASLAEIGHQIVCTDKDPAKIQTLQAGGLPIYEPHLDAMVARNRAARSLEFTPDAADAIAAGDAIFICVNTPVLESGDVDLSEFDGLARLIAARSTRPKLVIEKSTVSVQTGQRLKQALGTYARAGGVSFQVASNPEFLREGTAVEDFLHPDRIVVGVEEAAAEQLFREIYRPILERTFTCPVHVPACPPGARPPLVITTLDTAELIKHAANSFLALKISYANALAELCERLGTDVEEVTRAMGMDPRIGPEFLRAGLGFGGSCLPKDVQAFARLAEQAGVDLGLLREVQRINQRRTGAFLEKMKHVLGLLNDKQIGILGLAFKPLTDDIRFSPALDLMDRLLAEGAQLRAYDPKAMKKTRALFPQVRYGRDPYEVADAAEALVIATEWDEFRTLDWKRIRDSMTRPLVFDGRNQLDPESMRVLGFSYHAVGRPD